VIFADITSSVVASRTKTAHVIMSSGLGFALKPWLFGVIGLAGLNFERKIRSNFLID
jgi:hypothetical protein